MEAKEYSKLVHLLTTARDSAEKMKGDMRILNEHASTDECGSANAYLVGKSAGEIEKGLNSALEELKRIGADTITKVAGQ